MNEATLGIAQSLQSRLFQRRLMHAWESDGSLMEDWWKFELKCFEE